MDIDKIHNTPVSDEMDFETVSGLIEDMLSIEPDADLDVEILKHPKIFGVLSRLHAVHARKLALLTSQKAKVEWQRERHYGGKMPAAHYKQDPLNEAVLKADIPKYMAVDPIVLEMRGVVAEQDRIVSMIENAQNQLRNRSWDIKNVIAYRQMLLGV